MAHPFSAVPLGFSVMGARPSGGAAAPGTRSRCRTCCPKSPTCSWRHGARAATRRWPGSSGEARHPPVTRSRTSSPRSPTCGTTSSTRAAINACSAAKSASRVAGATGHERGYVMDLATLWRLARGWYEGRLERGYQRREPSHARGILPVGRADRAVLGPLSAVAGVDPALSRSRKTGSRFWVAVRGRPARGRTPRWAAADPDCAHAPYPAAGRPPPGSIRRARPSADSASAAAVARIALVTPTAAIGRPRPRTFKRRYAGLNTFGACLLWQRSLRGGH